jgi:hypothetical protein
VAAHALRKCFKALAIQPTKYGCQLVTAKMMAVISFSYVKQPRWCGERAMLAKASSAGR